MDGPLRHPGRVLVVDEERVDTVRAILCGAVVTAVAGVAVAGQALSRVVDLWQLVQSEVEQLGKGGGERGEHLRAELQPGPQADIAVFRSGRFSVVHARHCGESCVTRRRHACIYARDATLSAFRPGSDTTGCLFWREHVGTGV